MTKSKPFKLPSVNEDKRSLFENLQIISLAAVEDPDMEYILRKVQRAFSTAFHVSLLETENLDLEYMLRHIYEFDYENRNDQDRAEIAIKLDKGRNKEVIEEDTRISEDDAWAAEIAAELELEKQKHEKEKKPKTSKPSEESPPDINLRFDEETP